MKTKKWYDYLWLVSATYLILGFFNILFAWIGLLCFFIPLLIAIFGGDKLYCNRFCGRGQLFDLLGNKLHLSRKKDIPKFLRKKWFRYAFLAFFLFMFVNMLFLTWQVATGSQTLKEVVTLLWTWKLPWQWANIQANVSPWVVQFAYGFYSVMLTSTVLGLVTMALYKPRSWCVYCPMGTMTQCICSVKHHKDASE